MIHNMSVVSEIQQHTDNANKQTNKTPAHCTEPKTLGFTAAFRTTRLHHKHSAIKGTNVSVTRQC